MNKQIRIKWHISYKIVKPQITILIKKVKKKTKLNLYRKNVISNKVYGHAWFW
jgi:hypothetical protein